MSLSKPFGFMAGAAGAAWDPTVGGTYSVEHHWDWTDTSTMTFGGTGVSGSEVATITDKVGSITFQPVNGPSGTNASKIITTGSFSTTHNATYLSGSPYQNYNGGTYNWLPNTLKAHSDFSVVCICGSEDWDRYTNNNPRAMWYARSNAYPSEGWDNIIAFMFYQDTWVTRLCSGSGQYRWGIGSYEGNWGTGVNAPTRIDFGSAPDSMANPAVYSISHDETHPTLAEHYVFKRNNDPVCSPYFRATSVTANGEGFVIGGAPIGMNEKNCFEGMFYHTVVYDQILTDSDMDAIYNSWNTFFNG